MLLSAYIAMENRRGMMLLLFSVIVMKKSRGTVRDFFFVVLNMDMNLE